MSKLMAVSDDAKIVMGALFGLRLTDLSFKMQETRPTERMQAALDELVKAGMVHRERINSAGGVRYKPCHDAEPYGKWFRKKSEADPEFGKFPITEPIPPASREERRGEG